MYINFDTKIIKVDSEKEYTFQEAVAQGVITQAQLDQDEQHLLEGVLRDLEDAGYKDCTEEANKQNGSNHLYVFEYPNGHGVCCCDTIDEVFDLGETVL